MSNSLLGVSSGSKLFEYGAIVVLIGLRVYNTNRLTHLINVFIGTSDIVQVDMESWHLLVGQKAAAEPFCGVKFSAANAAMKTCYTPAFKFCT